MERIARNRKTRRAVAQINVVPYIDVMLVLLIIFMITAPLPQTGIEVDLPHAQSKSVDLKDQKPVVITIEKGNKYYINQGDEQTPRSLSELVAILRLFVSDRNLKEVLVKSDKSVSYGVFVKVMALVKEAGVEKVGLLTENDL
jgi:biopolymer transport protein TolR